MLKAPAWFETALKAHSDTDSLLVDGAQIAIRHWGDPRLPPLVLVHGNGATAHWWDHIAPYFSDEWSVTALDFSGHGDSDRRPEYSFGQWSREVRAVVDLVTQPTGIRPIVIAHSMGGRASVRAAADDDSAYGGLIILDSAFDDLWREGQKRLPKPPPGPITPKRYASHDEAWSKYRLMEGTDGSVEPYILAHVARTSTRDIDDGGVTWKMDPHARRRTDAAPLSVRLGEISCPLVIFRAEEGRLAPDLAERLLENARRPVRVITIPLTSHHVMLDEPIALITGVRVVLAEWSEAREPAEVQV